MSDKKDFKIVIKDSDLHIRKVPVKPTTKHVDKKKYRRNEKHKRSYDLLCYIHYLISFLKYFSYNAIRCASFGAFLLL